MQVNKNRKKNTVWGINTEILERYGEVNVQVKKRGVG
jgi:hypothetical protein